MASSDVGAIPGAKAVLGTEGSFLMGVSCVAPEACIAVGYHNPRSGVTVTLAERWNGSRWSLQQTRNLPGALVSYLISVACPTRHYCVAVGYDETVPGESRSLIEVWNGSNWVIQPSPEPLSSTASYLTGVSCTSADACVAVGYRYTRSGPARGLAESWDGTKWVIRASPNPAGAVDSYLVDVSCAAAKVCTAVGSLTDTAYVEKTLAEQWDGSRWIVEATPSPHHDVFSPLLGVSCPSTDVCTAVGSGENNAGRTLALAERRARGTWVVETTASPEHANDDALNDVSCPAANACTAVGYFSLASGKQFTLAEAWHGTTWRRYAPPNPAAITGSILNSLSCPNSEFCMGVGYTGDSVVRERPLSEAWNGTKWSLLTTPSP
jgi:hypothetical protein